MNKIGHNHSLEKGIFFKSIEISSTKLNPSYIRRLIVNEIVPIPHCVTFWMRNRNANIDSEIWQIAKNCTKETRLRILHWKIIHNIYPTGILLKKMKLSDSEYCHHCQVTDYIEHFFIECSQVRALWTEVNQVIQIETDTSVSLNSNDILFGLRHNSKKLNKEKVSRINLIILIAKMSISKHKYGKSNNLIYTFYNECHLRGLNIK